LRSVDELLTVAEVAELLKLNQQTVRNMIDRREIAAVRLGRRRVRIRQSALEAFVAAGEMPAAEDNGQPEPTAENAEARALLGAGLAESTAALADADDQALASALIELADAARNLAESLRAGEGASGSERKSDP
jgi:excisionase family DNA binding protein